MKEDGALVIFSGGADSTICLHWALERFAKTKVEAITFDYGQRHRIELLCATEICKRLGIAQKIVPISSLAALGGNALVNQDQAIELKGKGALPSTFVPGRNLIFITLAAAYAWQKNTRHLVTGVCETDYSGYPDCRKQTLDYLKLALNAGMEGAFEIHTPLMYLSKAQSIVLAKQEGAFNSLALSHTCYEGMRPPCGKCPSCELRAKGFSEAGEVDPLLGSDWKP